MQSQLQHWYAPLRQLTSLGSRKSKIRNMGDLAAARRVHLSQFSHQMMWQLGCGRLLAT